MVDYWFGGVDTAVLFDCQQKRHVICHGWQKRFGHRPEADDILICSCPCGHAGARNLAEKGVLRPPPGWDVERFCLQLIDGSGEAS